MALNSLLRRVSLLALIIFTSARSVAWGGGFFLYETGTQDVGLASAGYGAGTVDPSTLFTNPAGMTHLEGDQLMVNLQGLVPKLQFSPDSGSTKTGTDGGQALVPLPGGSVFYEHSLTKDLKIGIGTFAYFGGALEYNLNWVGRYFLQGATIIGLEEQRVASVLLGSARAGRAGLPRGRGPCPGCNSHGRDAGVPGNSLQ